MRIATASQLIRPQAAADLGVGLAALPVLEGCANGGGFQ